MTQKIFAAPWLALCLGLPLFAAAQADSPAEPRPGLAAFASEEALQAFLAPLAEQRRELLEAERRRQEQARQRALEQQRLDEAERRKWALDHPGEPFPAPPPMPVPAPALMAVAQAPALQSVEVAGGITNNQSAGVDEGGIVKRHGKHLVVLRRGRLFTIDVDRHTLRPVSSLDAQAPGLAAGGTWIDEMLISGDTIAVIGYSYPRGGTEVGLFHIDADGQLSYRSTLHLRSADYYSARNYASRLVGQQLIFYTPISLTPWRDLAEQLPAFRRWSGDANAPFERIALATRLYRHAQVPDRQHGITLHTVVTCDLAQAEPSCQATGLFGPAGRVFYVSSSAVYVLTAPPFTRPGRAAPQASLYRMPLDGGPPAALQVQGQAIDQFSFLEADGHLNLLLRNAGPAGDGMWRAEFNGSSRGLALLRVPLGDFGPGGEPVAADRYRALPPLSRESCSLQNRFVGAYLLYGSGCAWRTNKSADAAVNAVAYATPRQPVAELPLDHGVDRIEALGADAILIGAKGRDLVFSALRLRGAAAPALAGRHVQAGASQAETRSHGFFYKPLDDVQGLIGLPLRGGAEPGYRQLRAGSTAVLFLRNDHLRMQPIGQLTAGPARGDDGCRVSCVDWYGNARPLFIDDRVFALMGYELVEGRVLQREGRDELVELRRVNFQPDR